MFSQKFNNDQLSGLADLCFDLAKGAFGFVLLPAFTLTDAPILSFMKIIIAIFSGLAFTYIALVLLKAKKENI